MSQKKKEHEEEMEGGGGPEREMEKLHRGIIQLME